MGKESRRRSKISRKRKRTRPAVEAKPTSVHGLTDDLLELVFLGLDSPVCLIRTASTCKRWRRIVAGAGGDFLRRFRSLHEPPAALGHFYYTVDIDPPCSFGESHVFPSEDPIFVPSSAASAFGAAGPDGRHLSLGFVPSTIGLRELVDSRDSLLLLLEDKDGSAVRDCWRYDDGDRMIPHLVVCEPLTRRYQELPPLSLNPVCVVGAFLFDSVAAIESGSEIGMDSFRVLVVAYQPDYDNDDRYRHGSPYAIVFTSRKDGGWHHGEEDYEGVYLPRLAEIHFAGRTGGRIYWCCEDKQVMVLDESTLEFTTMALPENMKWEFDTDNFRVVGGGAGGSGTVRFIRLIGGELEVFSKPDDGCCTDWVLEKSVRLAEASLGMPERQEEYFVKPAKIIRTTDSFVVLSPKEKTWLFSVDLEAMELEREHERNRYSGMAYPCRLPWPPLLRACVD